MTAKYANAEIILAKRTGPNPFVAKVDGDTVILTDKEGSFKMEFHIAEDDEWHSFNFMHEGKAYRADGNMCVKEGKATICLYCLHEKDGSEETDTSEWWEVEVGA